METHDYQKTITINKPAGEVYAAITKNIEAWWSNDFSGAAASTGDQYTITFGKTQKTFEIVEAVLNEKVIWLCTKAHINLATLTKKDEWVGTHLIWTLNSTGHGTKLNFLHQGLNKNFECYGVCEAGWDYFINSLYAYLTTGAGTPYLKMEELLA